MNYNNKYIKYKSKYKLLNQKGGGILYLIFYNSEGEYIDLKQTNQQNFLVDLKNYIHSSNLNNPGNM